MTDKQSRCRRCGKLFAPQDGKSMCARCTEKYLEDGARVREALEQHGLTTHDDIAAFAGVTVDEVEEILNDPEAMKKRVVDERVCSRCKARPAQNRSEYCLVCRMELNKAFGDAARALAASIEHDMSRAQPARPARPTTVVTTMDRKRARTGSSRINPTPRSRYSP